MQQLSSHQFKIVYQWLGIDLNKLGCVMLDLDPIQKRIEDDKLYYSSDSNKFWIKGWVAEKTPHITLLYGLLSEAVNYKSHIEEVLKDWNLDNVEIDHFGYFDSPYSDEPYYCIVAHIKVTDTLLEGHNRLQFLPHINTFSGYKPHMTIAYIKKELGDKYRDNLIEELNKTFKGISLIVKEDINLGGNK